MGNRRKSFNRSQQPFTSNKVQTSKASYYSALEDEAESVLSEKILKEEAIPVSLESNVENSTHLSFTSWPELSESTANTSIFTDKDFTGNNSSAAIKANSQGLDQVAGKLCEMITENDAFRQIITDAVSLAFHENLNKLETEVKSLKEENQLLKQQLENQEQYSRRNCLLIHGVPPNTETSTDDTAKQFFEEALGLDIAENDIDRSHRLGRANGPIIIKFTRHNTKNWIYQNKKKLKGTKYLITESLTATRKNCLNQLKKLRDEKVVTAYWTLDGEIFYIKTSDTTKKIHLKSLNVNEIKQ